MRKEWLRREGGVQEVEFVAYEEKDEMMVVRVVMGPVRRAQYEKRFESEEEREARKRRSKERGMPPPGWGK